MCGQTTKGTIRKKASMSHIEKGIRILQGEEYAPQRHTSPRERIDNKRDSGSICRLWRM